MSKAAEKRKELTASAKQAEDKASDKAARAKKEADDLLQFRLCERQCVCSAETCQWSLHSICPAENCGALIYPLSQCTSEGCRLLKIQLNKQKAAEKKAKEVQDLVDFKICKDNIATFGREPLVCFCTAHVDTDICKWDGFAICENPPCQVLLPPMTFCRKRVCALYRKRSGTIPIAPRKKRQAPKKKVAKKVTSARQFDSDSSSAASDTPPRRKAPPRRTSARSTPPKPAVLDGSGTSSSESESGSDRDVESPPKVKTTPVKLGKKNAVKLVQKNQKKVLTREPTLTLDGDYVVSEIVEGPRKKDGKYLVRWEGYGSDDNTWEPRANLPDECFEDKEKSSDESGDDLPLHLTIAKPVENPKPVIPRLTPPRKNKFVPTVATRFGHAPAPDLPKLRKRPSATQFSL